MHILPQFKQHIRKGEGNELWAAGRSGDFIPVRPIAVRLGGVLSDWESFAALSSFASSGPLGGYRGAGGGDCPQIQE